MGNNTSSTRKSTAGIRHGGASIRKSAVNAANHSLDEDFSDLILHEVKKKQEKQNPIRPITSSSGSTTDDTLPKNEFSNGMIEDEYNELNAGLIETDVAELNRNIIPDEDSNSDAEMEDMSISLNDVSNTNNNAVTELEPDTPTPDWSKVDFTNILPPKAPGQSNEPGGRLPRGPDDLSNSKNSSSSQMRRLIPVEIKWVNSTKENIQKIAIIGSFSNWRDMIRLKKSKTFDNEYTVTIRLPLGVHKLLYVINNEYRISDQLPTATDQEGIFFNWFEVLDAGHLFNHSQNLPQRTEASTNYDANIIGTPTGDVYQAGRYEVDRINRKSTSFLTSVSKQESGTEISHVEYMDEDNTQHDPRAQADRNVSQHQGFKSPPGISDPGAYTPFHGLTSSSSLLAEKQKPIEYSSEIPAMFVNYDYFKQKGPSYELPEPPQLPAHLNNVLLNKLLNPHQSNTSIPTAAAEAAISAAHVSSSTGLGSSSLGGTSSRRPALRRADSSYYASSSNDYLAIPNHVILNHLMTTSIRNEVLTVACITRYLGKFVTQIMHSPADT